MKLISLSLKRRAKEGVMMPGESATGLGALGPEETIAARRLSQKYASQLIVAAQKFC
jgi:hypothetical protein